MQCLQDILAWTRQCNCCPPDSIAAAYVQLYPVGAEVLLYEPIVFDLAALAVLCRTVLGLLYSAVNVVSICLLVRSSETYQLHAELAAEAGPHFCLSHCHVASTGHACRYSKSQEAVDLMGKFKSLLDPNQILNPYKLLPEKNRLYQPAHGHIQQSSAVTR